MEEGPLSKLQLLLSTIAISLAVFMFVLDYTIANVAVPYIAGGLASGVDEGTYVLTFFAVGNAVFLPMTGFLTRKYGMTRTLVVAILFFTLFSFLCGAAPTLLYLVLFRFLQGAAAGPIIPIGQAILAHIYPPKKLNIIMAIFSMVVLVAPVFGPIIGGYLCVNYDWRWIFYINVPIGIFCGVVIGAYLPFLNHPNKEEKIDIVSFCLLLIGMSCFQLFLDKGQQWDWFASTKIIVSFSTFLITTAYLILYSVRAKKPLLDLSVFKVKEFAISTILIFSVYSIYMGTVVIIPLWLQTFMGYDALWAGIAVSPIGIGSIAFAVISAKLKEKIGRVVPLLLGFMTMALACLYTTQFTPEVNLFHLMVSRIILGVGIGFWVSPLITMPAETLAKDQLSNGLGIFHFIRSLSGGIGMSVFVTMFQRRTIHQHNNIISTISPYNPQSADYLEGITRYGLHGESALELFNKSVDRQASVLAIDEISQFMVWALLLLSLLVLVTLSTSNRPKESVQLGNLPTME